MATTTTNYAWSKPEPFSATDEDLWGYILNSTIDDIDAEIKTSTADRSMADFIFSRIMFKDEGEVRYDLGSTLNGALSIDYTNGHYQYGTITGNITSVAISNAPPSGKGGWLTIELTEGGSGGYTVDTTGLYSGNDVEFITDLAAVNILYLHQLSGGGWVVASNPDITVIP